MALPRIQIPFTVDLATTGAAVAGASVTVIDRSTSSTANVYGSETAVNALSQPFPTDVNGRIPGWVEPGQYAIQVTGTGITSYVMDFDAVSGKKSASYSTTHVSTNRTFDPTTSTYGQMAQVLATLIQDLQNKGVVS